MFKITNERAGDSRYSGITEKNHISQFILSLKRPESYYPVTTLTRIIARVSETAIIQFDIEGKTYWCKPYEYEVVKFALQSCKSYVHILYVAGSVSPTEGETSMGTGRFSASGVDGYEVHLKFD